MIDLTAYDGSVTLVVEGADTRIEGFIPWDIIYDVTSFYKQGYQYAPRYRAGLWDGRIRLFNRRTKTFPSGLTQAVKRALEAADIKVQVDDQRQMPPLPPINQEWFRGLKLEGVSFDYPYDFQPKAAWELLEAKRGIADMATNSGKTECACLITAALRLPTLFIVPGKDLLYQTRERFKKRLQLDDTAVGIIGDGHWEQGEWITVSTAASLYSKIDKPETIDLLNSIDLLFADEAHTAGSDSWYQVLRKCNAYFRFGLSGTPLKRTDGADLKLIAVTGDVVTSIKNKELIARGVSNKVEIQFLSVNKPSNIHPNTPYRDVYKLGIVENIYRTRALCLKVAEYVKSGRQVIILVREIAHGYAFDRAVWTTKQNSFIPHQFINGKESMDVRLKAAEDYKKGDLRVLIVTSIFDQGIDIKCIDALVLGGGLKSSIKSLQRIGRGVRKGGVSDTLIVLDTADFTHHYLTEHSIQRLKDYKAEDCFDIKILK